MYIMPSQKEALQTAINSKIMLLTGGPGTGKTTVIKGIVELYAEVHGLSLSYSDYQEDDYPIVLAHQQVKITRIYRVGSNDNSSSNWMESETQPEDILDNEIKSKAHNY